MNTTNKTAVDVGEQFDKRFVYGVRADPRGRLDELEQIKQWILDTVLTQAHQQGERDERERLRRFIGMRYPKTDETKELIAEIMKALQQPLPDKE